jgi:prepilin-type N-terminal cleavage/methylation domain-containing protein
LYVPSGQTLPALAAAPDDGQGIASVEALMHRQAFTLVELVVVLVIVGILAAVAAPTFLATHESVEITALEQDLRVVRDAIASYAADHGGALPGENATEADLKADLAPYLRKFPRNALNQSDKVHVQTSGAAFGSVQVGGYGWLYDNATGDIRANSDNLASDGVTRLLER